MLGSAEKGNVVQLFPHETFSLLWGQSQHIGIDKGIYLFVCGFACVTWSSAKEPEAGAWG